MCNVLTFLLLYSLIHSGKEEIIREHKFTCHACQDSQGPWWKHPSR